MSNISSVPEVQEGFSKPKVSLDDRIVEVQRAVNSIWIPRSTIWFGPSKGLTTRTPPRACAGFFST